MSERIFRIGDELMTGDDVRDWQHRVRALFRDLSIDCPIKADGVYGHHTRSYTAALCRAYGLNASYAMRDGITQELRTKLRTKDFTRAERRKRWSLARMKYRQTLRKRWVKKKVHPPVNRIIEDSWGYHPGVHDGIDVICPPNVACFAMVKSRVIDVRRGGWWGKAPTGDVTKGDGIVQLEVLESVGPFRKGQHIGYGHCEHPRVKVGEIVQAGEVIALAGLAVAWHIHLMLNDGSTTRGIGNRDPRAILDYSVKHG